jgi:hypothetical protein
MCPRRSFIIVASMAVARHHKYGKHHDGGRAAQRRLPRPPRAPELALLTIVIIDAIY